MVIHRVPDFRFSVDIFRIFSMLFVIEIRYNIILENEDGIKMEMGELTANIMEI